MAVRQSCMEVRLSCGFPVCKAAGNCYHEMRIDSMPNVWLRFHSYESYPVSVRKEILLKY